MRLTLFLIIFSHFSIFSQELAPPPTVNTPNPAPILPVAIWECGCGMEAHYAGGSKALKRYVNEHIVLPSNIQWGDVSRVRAYVQFVVEKDGSLSDIRVIHTNFSEVNEFILSAFQGMNNWIAGEHECRSVRTRVRVPVSLVIR